MLSKRLEDLIAAYEPIDDLQERMTLVVDAASRRAMLPESQRVEENRIRGCVSSAWVEGRLVDGRCVFSCAADSPLVHGLLSTLCDFYSGATPEEVSSCELDPLAALGLVKNLSPTRQNGLGQARRRLREIAGTLTAEPFAS